MEVEIFSSASSLCITAFPMDMEPEDLVSHQPESHSKLKIVKATHSWRSFGSLIINFDACQSNCEVRDLDWNSIQNAQEKMVKMTALHLSRYQ